MVTEIVSFPDSLQCLSTEDYCRICLSCFSMGSGICLWFKMIFQWEMPILTKITRDIKLLIMAVLVGLRVLLQIAKRPRNRCGGYRRFFFCSHKLQKSILTRIGFASFFLFTLGLIFCSLNWIFLSMMLLHLVEKKKILQMASLQKRKMFMLLIFIYAKRVILL